MRLAGVVLLLAMFACASPARAQTGGEAALFAIPLLALDAALVFGGAVTMVGTALSLRDDPPSAGWREASLGFGSVCSALGAFWVWLYFDDRHIKSSTPDATVYESSPAMLVIAAIHGGVGAMNFAAAILSLHFDSVPVALVPVGGLDREGTPFAGVGLSFDEL